MNVKCKCRHCDGKIEFSSNDAGREITCPHCGLETQLFIPPIPGFPPAPAKNHLRWLIGIAVIFALGLIIGAINCVAEQFTPVYFFQGFGMALGMMFSLLIYFIPAVVGRRKKNANAILILNLLAGWTFIGWVVALVWAVAKD
jgi:hypothetical protein